MPELLHTCCAGTAENVANCAGPGRAFDTGNTTNGNGGEELTVRDI